MGSHGGSVPQLCELIKIVPIVVALFLLAGCSHILLFCSECTTVLFKTLFFMLSTLEMRLWGYVKKPAKNAFIEGSTSKGFCLVTGNCQSWILGIGEANELSRGRWNVLCGAAL